MFGDPVEFDMANLWITHGILVKLI